MSASHAYLLFGLLAGLLAAPAPVSAATVYRWTDEQGQVHYGDVVPEKYRKRAKPVTPASADPTTEQLREAQQRSARQKARAAAIAGKAPTPASAAASTVQAPPPVTKRPARVPDERTDCQTWARLYKESLDCFAPFRTARGATRGEAFDHCTPVDEPPTRCRQRVP
jgi:Domain of unknown function (DUF4124)